jgi:MFS family permease
MLFNGMNSKVDRTVVEGASHLNNKSGPWWKDRGLRTLNFLIFIPLMSEYVQGYDASLINNVQQLPVWQKGMTAPSTSDGCPFLLRHFTEFHHPTGSLLGILSASYWVGNVLGVFFITPLSDRWGRRLAMFFGSIVAIIGTALCTGAIDGQAKSLLYSAQALTFSCSGNVHCRTFAAWYRWSCGWRNWASE